MNHHRRCAIYTRKSSEEGLEQDFNSLHAQREACEAFIKSQKHEGWSLIKTAYDDGGISGGTMHRPALQTLLDDIRAARVDVVVVYKVDRLTRSLADFARMVELFDHHHVSFVSVTQQFNTTSSMGRLTLNVLLSFAQFEREVTGERIRDKIKASKAKGIWMGGPVPLGYEASDRKLIIHTGEAETVRTIFDLYLNLGNVRRLAQRLGQMKIVSRNGADWSCGALYTILGNPIYVGKIRHKDVLHDGLHEPIIAQNIWDQVQTQLINNKSGVQGQHRVTEPSLLTGKLFDQAGERLVPVHTQKRGRRYRYYVSERLKVGKSRDGWRLPSKEIESLIARLAREILTGGLPELLTDTKLASHDVAELMRKLQEVSTNLDDADILSGLVSKVELTSDGLALTMNLTSFLPKAASVAHGLTIRRQLPLAIRRRGVEMRLVSHSNRGSATMDPILVKTLALGRIWFDEWLTGRVVTLKDIAAREGLSQSYVGDVIKLAFTSPLMVEAILSGHQPEALVADHLLKADMPLRWNDQALRFGFR